MEMEISRQQAVTLLLAIWRGIPADYKSKYRMNIWEQFQNQIVSAAYTSNLGKFINSLCYSLNADIGQNAKERQLAEAILNSGQDAALLKLLQEETALIVLMVRVEMQERRAEFEAEYLGKENEDV